MDKTSSSTSKHRKGENGAFIETNNPYQYLLSNSNTTSTCTVIDGNSTRNLNANYTQFITPINLSKPNEVFGKAAVVTQSNNGQIPKFSKYSGTSCRISLICNQNYFHLVSDFYWYSCDSVTVYVTDNHEFIFGRKSSCNILIYITLLLTSISLAHQRYPRVEELCLFMG